MESELKLHENENDHKTKHRLSDENHRFPIGALAKQSDGLSFAPCSARAPDTMHIVLTILRGIVVDHQVNVFDVLGTSNCFLSSLAAL